MRLKQLIAVGAYVSGVQEPAAAHEVYPGQCIVIRASLPTNRLACPRVACPHHPTVYL
jgi:hypothetical protein